MKRIVTTVRTHTTQERFSSRRYEEQLVTSTSTEREVTSIGGRNLAKDAVIQELESRSEMVESEYREQTVESDLTTYEPAHQIHLKLDTTGTRARKKSSSADRERVERSLTREEYRESGRIETTYQEPVAPTQDELDLAYALDGIKLREDPVEEPLDLSHVPVAPEIYAEFKKELINQRKAVKEEAIEVEAPVEWAPPPMPEIPKRAYICAACDNLITGRCITAMMRKFHPEHFVCSFCLKQLNKGTFKEKAEKPYCHGCFVRLFG